MTKWRCRSCQTAHDGMGVDCPECGTPQRIPVTFPDGQRRYLPRGMTIEGFDAFFEQMEPPF